MAAETSFDYYYGDESNQFSFYRIPRQLVTGDRFKRLSTDAKLLYGLLLDRMGLSAKNGWYDEQGRVYIYYTLDEIQEDLNCGHDKATRMLVELDNGKNGFGLIERVRQGQGRPTKIYVNQKRQPADWFVPHFCPRYTAPCWGHWGAEAHRTIQGRARPQGCRHYPRQGRRGPEARRAAQGCA